MDFLKDVFGGANIFGASGNNTDSLVKNGLLQQTDVDKASNQSLFRGLLGTAVGYLAQPKNQGYGSSIPYIFKGLQNGMDAAQQPYDQLTKDASQNMKLQDYQAEKDLKAQEAAKAAQFAKFQQGFGAKTPNMVTGGGLQKEGDPRLHQTNQNGTTTQIAPNFNPVTQAPQTSEFNANKYIDDALANGTITYDQAQKYKADFAPKDNSYVLKEGDIKYDGEGNIIAQNEKTKVESATTAMKEYKAMGPSEKYPTFQSYLDSKNAASGVTINNGPQNKRDESAWGVFTDSQSQGVEARKTLGNLQEQVATLEKMGNFAGATSDTKTTMIQLAKDFGLPIPGNLDNEADYNQAMKSLQIQAALGMKKPGTGPMTDKDFENFQNTVSKTTNTKAANKLIIDVARANAKATEEYAQRMRDYIKKNEGKADFNIYQERANIWSDIQSKRKVELDSQLAALNVGEDTGSNSSSGGWSIVQ